eukprot:Ihof_evm18s43 gene=Ihof_evmTU18s43
MQNITRFTNVRVLRNHKLTWSDLWIQDGKIIDAPSHSELTHVDYKTVDGLGNIVAPGFIDVQVNGGFGTDFSSGDVTVRDLQKVGRQLLQHGVTSFCPTLVTSPSYKYKHTIPIFARYAGGPDQGATVLGIHLDGPFINPEKAGAHDSTHTLAPVKGMDSLNEHYGPLEHVNIVTLAPELPGAIEAIKGLKAKGIIVSIGHTTASYDQAKAGVEVGATMLTRLFSSMSPFHHRDPGAVGLIGDVGFRPNYTLICDGIHAHPNSVRLAYHAHPQGIVLVSDATAAMGLPDGIHQLGDMKVHLQGLKATIDGTDILAGSAVDMVTCVRNFKKFTGCTTAQALEVASLSPAELLHIQQTKGQLKAGCDADFIILNDNLDVLATFIDGM